MIGGVIEGLTRGEIGGQGFDSYSSDWGLIGGYSGG